MGNVVRRTGYFKGTKDTLMLSDVEKFIYFRVKKNVNEKY